MEFEFNRRQPFASAVHSLARIDYLLSERDYWRDGLGDDGDTPEEKKMLAGMTHASFAYELYSLRYTAGAPISTLRAELTSVVEAYERYQKALEVYEQIPQVAPLGFDDLKDYERALQLVSLCYLLHRRDLLPRLRALFDPAYGGEDTVYEDLMSFDVAGRADVDQWYHAEPYTRLVNSMYLDQPEANVELKAYCESWYKCFEYAPWHNSHTRIEGTEGDYFGYWAFEAGAVALLYDLDDSAIDHMVYPRDLVAWARDNSALSEEDSAGIARLRVMAGEPCPRAGWWVTPAKANSRRRLEAGETMPSLGGDYGTTIWQWDERQDGGLA
ncbi:PoNe immunity protein domain-containing protein [Pseudorhodoferax sp.]|uniref:PoNe immunity protein domain-containing protein n=1 Tax=Pseudorhodoferax sp. TaxID=1993553 RepID=UPI0039E3C632